MLPPPTPNFILFQLNFDVKFPLLRLLLFLIELKSTIFSHNIRGGRNGIMLIPAKVPILKFKDSVGNLDIDLSVDNPTRYKILFSYKISCLLGL